VLSLETLTPHGTSERFKMSREPSKSSVTWQAASMEASGDPARASEASPGRHEPRRQFGMESEVLQRVAELERKVARQQRDSEHLAATNARLRMENGALRANSSAEEVESPAAVARTADVRGPSSRLPKREALPVSTLDPTPPHKPRSPEPAVVRGWVPLCALSSDASNVREPEGRSPYGGQSPGISELPVPLSLGLQKEVDGPIDDNVFRRGTLWLWSRTMADLDEDEIAMLSEVPLKPRRVQAPRARVR